MARWFHWSDLRRPKSDPTGLLRLELLVALARIAHRQCGPEFLDGRQLVRTDVGEQSVNRHVDGTFIFCLNSCVVHITQYGRTR